MGGIIIDMDAIQRRMTDDFNEIFGPMGMMMFIEHFPDFKPRRSFWQKLKDEIAARPRVF